jgi:hypothetical protein
VRDYVGPLLILLLCVGICAALFGLAVVLAQR